MTNSEKQPVNYEEALNEFLQKSSLYLKKKEAVKKVIEKVIYENNSLWKEHKNLEALRYQFVYKIMEEKGLGVCSAEIEPSEFNTKHQEIEEASEIEKLGLFPIGSLRFVYFEYRGRSKGDYEPDYYYDVKNIFRVCHHHYPLKLVPLPQSVFSHLHYQDSYAAALSTHFKDIEQREDNKFYSLSPNKGREPLDASYLISPLPEKIFEYFNIPPLPAAAERA
ncbi:MAG: hypothetical protein V1808_03550 [Candidatus Daviesbacteria bacterium]